MVIVRHVFAPKVRLFRLILLIMTKDRRKGRVLILQIGNESNIGPKLGLRKVFFTPGAAHVFNADGAPIEPNGMAGKGRFRHELPNGPIPAHKKLGPHIERAIGKPWIFLGVKNWYVPSWESLAVQWTTTTRGLMSVISRP